MKPMTIKFSSFSYLFGYILFFFVFLTLKFFQDITIINERLKKEIASVKRKTLALFFSSFCSTVVCIRAVDHQRLNVYRLEISKTKNIHYEFRKFNQHVHHVHVYFRHHHLGQRHGLLLRLLLDHHHHHRHHHLHLLHLHHTKFRRRKLFFFPMSLIFLHLPHLHHQLHQYNRVQLLVQLNLVAYDQFQNQLLINSFLHYLQVPHQDLLELKKTKPIILFFFCQY